VERVVIVILGPTASGKTFSGIETAKKLDTEIISADSRQIYKYLNIGTAKPEPIELNAVKHHFIDELAPDIDFNASKFEIDSLKIITELLDKDKIPVVVGGSGLYIRALVNGIFDAAEADEGLRKHFLAIKEEKGIEYLYKELEKADPVSSAKMLPQNWKRVMRALEVFYVTGKPIWQVQAEYKRKTNIKFVQFGLNWNRDVLYDRINRRADQMIENGLIDETKKILSMGYGKELNSMNTVGYKEIISYLEGEYPLETAVELIKRNTRRFAKRQMTWFRKDQTINWFELSKPEDLISVPDKILKTV
jgi:tRNA dimethylallyltransferase